MGGACEIACHASQPRAHHCDAQRRMDVTVRRDKMLFALSDPSAQYRITNETYRNYLDPEQFQSSTPLVHQVSSLPD